jgi:hypothetical protein
MARLLGICLMFAALLTTTSLVRAEEPALIGMPRGCAPGMQAGCTCPDGSPGTMTCDATGMFSLCACASVSVTVPLIPVIPVIVDVMTQPPPRKKKKRSSGVGLLIGGAVTLGVGTVSLAWGIDILRHKGKDPAGIVMTSLGGTAMLVGLPLTIVGIVFVATRPSPNADKPPEERKDDAKVRFVPTADGFALSF